MKKILLVFVAMFNFADAVVINANTQTLYLGNDNVSCGRYTISNSSKLGDVRSFCSVIGTTPASNGVLWLRIQTEEYGAIDCSFVSGSLSQCYDNN